MVAVIVSNCALSFRQLVPTIRTSSQRKVAELSVHPYHHALVISRCYLSSATILWSPRARKSSLSFVVRSAGITQCCPNFLDQCVCVCVCVVIGAKVLNATIGPLSRCTLEKLVKSLRTRLQPQGVEFADGLCTLNKSIAVTVFDITVHYGFNYYKHYTHRYIVNV
jgi:hypothetical protein